MKNSFLGYGAHGYGAHGYDAAKVVSSSSYTTHGHGAGLIGGAKVLSSAPVISGNFLPEFKLIH